MKYLYLVSRFITTYIKLKAVLIISSLDCNSLTIKSNVIDSYVLYNIGSNYKSS